MYWGVASISAEEDVCQFSTFTVPTTFFIYFSIAENYKDIKNTFGLMRFIRLPDITITITLLLLLKSSCLVRFYSQFLSKLKYTIC